jgi:hypothetical protein
MELPNNGFFKKTFLEIIRTTPKLIGKGCSGERRHLRYPKAARDEITNEDNAYFFLTPEMLFTSNSSHTAKESTRIII